MQNFIPEMAKNIEEKKRKIKLEQDLQAERDFKQGLLQQQQEFQAEQNALNREAKEKELSSLDAYRKGMLNKKPSGGSGLAGLIQEERYRKMLEDREKKAREQTPQGKVEALSGEQKKRFDLSRQGLAATTKMEKFFDNNMDRWDRFKLIGDNDFTTAQREWEEAIGRMQSGGAINKEEGDRFRAMAPTLLDSPDTVKKKLISMRQTMQERLGSFGMSKEDLPKLMGAEGIEYQYTPSGLLLDKNQQTSTNQQKQLSQQDQEAISWAQQNPNDPRAKEILKQNGVQ